VELCLHSPNTPSWRGAQKKRRDNFDQSVLKDMRDYRQNIKVKGKRRETCDITQIMAVSTAESNVGPYDMKFVNQPLSKIITVSIIKTDHLHWEKVQLLKCRIPVLQHL
jgi:hypothetical protein